MQFTDLGSPGGFIEAVKRTVVSGLRDSLTGTTLSESNSRVHIDLEYPYEKQHYPGVWVQFSFSSLNDMGVGHRIDETEKTYTREWEFSGRVTLTILALSSLDRDRISDWIVSTYAFSSLPGEQEVLEESLNTPLLKALNESPYVRLSLKSGSLTPAGQSTSVGVPWDPDQLVYGDAFSFDIYGSFEAYIERGTYRLRRIDIHPELSLKPGDVQRGIPPGEFV